MVENLKMTAINTQYFKSASIGNDNKERKNALTNDVYSLFLNNHLRELPGYGTQYSKLAVNCTSCDDNLKKKNAKC